MHYKNLYGLHVTVSLLTESDSSIVRKQVQEEVVGDYSDAGRGDVHSRHVEHNRGVRVMVLEVVHCHYETVDQTLT